MKMSHFVFETQEILDQITDLRSNRRTAQTQTHLSPTNLSNVQMANVHFNLARFARRDVTVLLCPRCVCVEVISLLKSFPPRTGNHLILICIQ